MFQIDRKTAKKIYSQFQKTGSVAPDKGTDGIVEKERKLSEEDYKYIELLVKTYPEYFLDEFVACLKRDREKSCLTTMWNALKVFILQ